MCYVSVQVQFPVAFNKEDGTICKVNQSCRQDSTKAGYSCGCAVASGFYNLTVANVSLEDDAG